MIRIIGIDPGLAETGFGIIEAVNNKYNHITHGTCHTKAGEEMGTRLNKIYENICEILKKFKPEEAGIETLFFSKNITSAIPVAQARGVILLALKHCNVKTFDYSPLAIKMSIIGSGKAEKHQIQHMIKILLGLTENSDTAHSADALAAAICHLNNRQNNFF